MIQMDDHFIGMYLVHVYVTRFKNPGFNIHEIKLMILPEMDCWLSTLVHVYFALYRAIIVFHESGFFDSLFQAINKPQVVVWLHRLVMANFHYYLVTLSKKLLKTD